MTASGQKQTFSGSSLHVHFSAKSGRQSGCRGMSASDPKQTWAQTFGHTFSAAVSSLSAALTPSLGPSMSDLPIKRKLAAILYSDAVGFSRLMHEDEAETYQALREGLDRFTKAIESAGGRVINYAGDAILAEFGSVVDCVTTAINVQRAFAADYFDLPEDKKLRFRIGINLGEVIVDGSEIYGEGVNIAARLEALAEPGGIWLSGVVADQVEHRIDVEIEDKGDQQVKNIAQPIRAYKVVLSDTKRQELAAAPITERPSIAILPFDNLSGDEEQEYFSDGITEDITTALSRLGWLQVTARNTSFSYKGQSPDIRDVAKDLNVRYVLEGSIRKAGNRVRAAVQLIDGISGNHLWAEQYDRDLEDIFALQDEITSTVVGAIQPELAQAEIDRSRAKPPTSLDAWDQYQRGMHFLHRQGKDDLQEAERLLRHAVETDPGLSAAYSGLAQTLFMQFVGGYERDSGKLVTEAVAAARTALELDRNDVNAHVALGRALNCSALLSGDFDETLAAGKHAVEQYPNSATAHFALGRIYINVAQPNEAITHLGEAIRLSPRDPYRGAAMAGMAAAYFDLSDYEKTLELMTKANRAQPNLVWVIRLVRICALVLLGRNSEALKERDAILKRFPEATIGAMLSKFGRTARYAKIVETLRKIDFPE